ncbi:hypothetical protein AJ87_47190 [Rhizobium yanglingense]|nr:hypothetical protein AJ87_47190 [Rhizobium yanglingense]
MKGCVLAKQPQELALLCRINPKFLAVIGNVALVRAWHMHLPIVHILHGHFLLVRITPDDHKSFIRRL